MDRSRDIQTGAEVSRMFYRFLITEEQRMYSDFQKTGIVAAIIVTMIMSLPASSMGLPSGQTKEPTCSISGKVTIGGKPARGVPVLLRSEDGRIGRAIAKATTDPEGHYQMTGVPAGRYLLQAFAPAFIVGPSNNTMGRSGQIINIAAGESLEGVDIALTRGAAITGRVIGPDGQPLIQEYVRLLAVNERGQQVQISPGNSTDDRGVYRLFGLPPGRYILSVGLDTDGRAIREGNSGNTFYPRTYHPGVTVEAKATVVEVAAGSETTGVDIVLGSAAKAYSVSGRILDAATGKPLSGLTYGYGRLDQEERLNPPSYANSTSGTRGEFRLDGVPPGRYAAFADLPDDSELYSGTAAFTVNDSDVSEIEIKVHRGSAVSGTVVIDGAEEQRGAPRLSDLRLNVSSSQPNAAPVFRFVNVAADGSFRAVGLPGGVANIVLSMFPAPKGLSLLRVEHDGVEQKNGIEVGGAKEISGVKVVFGYGTGSIRGQVQIEGGEIPPGSTMVLSLGQIDPRDPQQYLPPQPFRSPYIMPDSSGRFAADGLLPGEYVLELTLQFRSVSGSPHISPKFVNQRVMVTNGTETQVTMIVDLNEKNQ